MLGNILTMGYKSTLLSTLIPVRYERTINTLYDLDQSGLPLAIPKATAIHHAIANDPRPIMQRIYNNSILYVYAGRKYTEKIRKM